MSNVSQAAKASTGTSVWLPLWLCTLGFVFAGSFGIFPYADDWGSLVQARDEVSAIEKDGRWSVIFSRTGAHWCPGIRLLYDASYSVVRSPSDTVIRICCMLVHGWGMLFVFLFARALGLRAKARILAMLAFAFHQTAVSPIFAYDMSSGAIAAALVWGALLLLMQAKGPKDKAKRIVTCMLFSLGLLCYETTLAFLPMVLAILVYQEHSLSREAVRRILARATPFLIVAVVFLIVRSLMGAPTVQFVSSAGASSRYRIAGPLLWFRNAVQLGLATVTPLSTVWWFAAIRRLQLAKLLLLGGTTILFIGAVLWGVVRFARNSGPGVVVLVFGLIVGSWFPVVLMGHVAESYTYICLPFIALMVGISSQGFLGCNRGRGMPIRLKQCCLVILFLGITIHAVSQRTKLGLMGRNGAKAQFWYGRMVTCLAKVPAGSKVVYYREPTQELAYSHFLQPGWYMSITQSAVEYAFPGRFRFPNRKHRVPDDDFRTLRKAFPASYVLRREGEGLVILPPEL